MMRLNWEALEAAVDRLAPKGSPRIKLLQIITIVLIFEGISVLILFSYDAAIIGVFSLALGIVMALLVFPYKKEVLEGKPEAPGLKEPVAQPLGMKLLDLIERGIGDVRVMVVFGAAIIALVLVYNLRFSQRSELGDLDTLSLLFGGMLIAYPIAARRYKTEAAFSLIFLGLVVLLLVLPQAVMSVSSGAGSSVGNAYVHYMLAEPFARILSVLGIHASSSGNNVAIVFQDGTPTSLSISAYCAGLYSFSIFVSAFVAFVLVFERMPAKKTAIVLACGLVAAYLGNVFRMVVIGLVGYYRGMDALLWAHRNAGWLIFLAWSSVFWYLVMKFATSPRVDTKKDVENDR